MTTIIDDKFSAKITTATHDMGEKAKHPAKGKGEIR